MKGGGSEIIGNAPYYKVDALPIQNETRSFIIIKVEGLGWGGGQIFQPLPPKNFSPSLVLTIDRFIGTGSVCK